MAPQVHFAAKTAREETQSMTRIPPHTHTKEIYSLKPSPREKEENNLKSNDSWSSNGSNFRFLIDFRFNQISANIVAACCSRMCRKLCKARTDVLSDSLLRARTSAEELLAAFGPALFSFHLLFFSSCRYLFPADLFGSFFGIDASKLQSPD